MKTRHLETSVIKSDRKLEVIMKSTKIIKLFLSGLILATALTVTTSKPNAHYAQAALQCLLSTTTATALSALSYRLTLHPKYPSVRGISQEIKKFRAQATQGQTAEEKEHALCILNDLYQDLPLDLLALMLSLLATGLSYKYVRKTIIHMAQLLSHT